jgi:hypothetical protein
MELEQTINTLEECASRVWEKVALVSKTAHSTAFPKKKNRLAIYLALPLLDKKNLTKLRADIELVCTYAKAWRFWSGLHSVEALVKQLNALSRIKCSPVNAVRDCLP